MREENKRNTPDVGRMPLARRLQQLWEQGQQPDVHQFLLRTGATAPKEFASVLAVDQWQRWQAGERILAEEYLGRYLAVAAHPELALELVYGEFLVREGRGEVPTLEEYLRRFPSYASLLEKQLELHRELEGDTQQSHTGHPGHAEFSFSLRSEEEGSAAASDAASWPVVPGYEILEELGRGGMGIVYKARHLALHRLTAVKMLRADTEAVPSELSRFRIEAEAVARLQHPNIVQIHDVGETQGRSFFVLEFVDGCNLNRYLAGTPLLPQAAAGLVEVLARAMSAAHLQGIVHRDLKPSNILLAGATLSLPTDAGGVGSRPALTGLVPKIADFGLAKLLPGDTGATSPDPHTQSGAILGTPSYMAPEQACGKSKAVGPAADVYALGAILYECLTGRPPFRAESSWETLRQVVHEEPVPPTRLQPKLPRDVETICLKCLQKEASRRYANAEALADDLHRFVSGKPIQARPVGAAARLWRWARREPRVAGLLGALLLVLTSGLVGMSWLWRRAELHYQESRWQYDRAEESSRDARRAVDAMLGEVGQERLKDIPEMEPVQRALLEKAAEFYDKFLTERGEDPSLREEAARAYSRLGQINKSLERLSESEAAYEKALALHAALAEDMPDEPRYRRLMAADLFNGLAALYLSGQRFNEAETPLLRAREILEPLAAEHAEEIEYQEDLADCYSNLGRLWSESGRYSQAEEVFRDSLKIRRRLARRLPAVAQFKIRLAASHNSLAVVYQNSKRPDRAESEYREALTICNELLHEHPGANEYWSAAGVCHDNLGWLYLAYLGRPSKAESSLLEARKIREKLAREHPSFVGYQADLAHTYRQLGLVYERLGQAKNYERFELQALDIMEHHPSDVPKRRFELTNTYQLLAWHYYTAGKMDIAESFYNKSLAQCDALVRQYPKVGPYRRTLGFILHGRGSLYADLERFRDAEDAYRKAIQVREELTQAAPGEPEALKNLAWSYNDLGNLYEKMDRLKPAEECHEKALAIRDRLHREFPRVTEYTIGLAISYGTRANRLRDGAKPFESLDWYGQAIQLLNGVLKEEPRHAEAREVLCTRCWGRATALSKFLGRHKEALLDWEQARNYDDGKYWDEIWVQKALTYARLGDHAKATSEMKALEAKATEQRKPAKEGTYYVMAYVYALSAKAAAEDRKLSSADQVRLSREYADRAVERIRRLHTQNYFNDPKAIEQMRTAPELQILRQRDDFLELLGGMERKLKDRRR